MAEKSERSWRQTAQTTRQIAADQDHLRAVHAKLAQTAEVLRRAGAALTEAAKLLSRIRQAERAAHDARGDGASADGMSGRSECDFRPSSLLTP